MVLTQPPTSDLNLTQLCGPGSYYVLQGIINYVFLNDMCADMVAADVIRHGSSPSS